MIMITITQWFILPTHCQVHGTDKPYGLRWAGDSSITHFINILITLRGYHINIKVHVHFNTVRIPGFHTHLIFQLLIQSFFCECDNDLKLLHKRIIAYRCVKISDITY